MDAARADKVRRVVATLNLITLALVIPAILYHSLFSLPPAQAPGAKLIVVVVLALIWLAIAAKPFAYRPWPFAVRAVVMVGGNLGMAALMRALH